MLCCESLILLQQGLIFLVQKGEMSLFLDQLIIFDNHLLSTHNGLLFQRPDIFGELIKVMLLCCQCLQASNPLLLKLNHHPLLGLSLLLQDVNLSRYQFMESLRLSTILLSSPELLFSCTAPARQSFDLFSEHLPLFGQGLAILGECCNCARVHLYGVSQHSILLGELPAALLLQGTNCLLLLLVGSEGVVVSGEGEQLFEEFFFTGEEGIVGDKVLFLFGEESARESDRVSGEFFDFELVCPDGEVLLITLDLIVFVVPAEVSEEGVCGLGFLLEVLIGLVFLLVEDDFKGVVHSNANVILFYLQAHIFIIIPDQSYSLLHHSSPALYLMPHAAIQAR